MKVVIHFQFLSMFGRNTKSWLILFALFILLIGAGCDTPSDGFPSEDCDKVTWNYNTTSPNGPSNWSSLCYGFSYCNGNRQSPIDVFGGGLDNGLPSLNSQLNYASTSTIIINNGGKALTFRVNEGSGSLLYDGIRYQLQGFQIKTPAEHRLQGVNYPMEIQIMHYNIDQSKVFIISLMVETGSENAFLQQFLPHLPSTVNAVYSSGNTYNLNNLLPANRGYFQYLGSITEPPCTQNVTWMVLEKTVQASATQINAFKNITGNNNRPQMPLNGRSIIFSPNK